MSDNKTTTPKDPSHIALDCPNKNCWLELEIRDEENKPVSGLNGVLTDAKGKEYKVSGPLQLIKPIAPGAATLVFKRKELVEKSLTLPMREEAQPNPVQEYADSTMGHEQTKKTYQLLDVSTQAASEQNDQKSDAKSEAIELATRQSYVLELPGMGIEYIALVGAQYSNSEGGKMMFAAHGVRMVKNIKITEKPKAKKTILLLTLKGDGSKYSVEYTLEQIAAVKASAKKHGALFKACDSLSAIYAYINTEKRSKYLIKQIDIYCHGLVSNIALGLTPEMFAGSVIGDKNPEQSISLSNYTALMPKVFLPDAEINSYACRTGMGPSNDRGMDLGREDEMTREGFDDRRNSLAQKMANHLGIVVRGYIRRSNYVNTWGSRADRRLPRGTEEGDRIGKLADERELNMEYVKASWNEDGALHPVEVSNDSLPEFSSEYAEFRRVK